MRAPFVARWLLRLLAPPGEADALIDDLEHEARQVLTASGTRAARRWMWWQAMHSVWPLARQRARTRRARTEGSMGFRGAWIDLRHAGRRLRRAPGFTAVAVFTLAIGIGTASAIFSLAYAVWLKPLPYRDADRLVVLQGVHAKSGDVASVFSGPDIRDFRDGAASVANLAAFGYGAQVARIGDERIRIGAYPATPNLFDVLGVTPAIGRTFSSGDVDQPVVILSHATWVSRFGKDPNVLSRTFELSGRPYSIIGVMPPGFRFPQILESDIWTASSFASWTDRNDRHLQLVARLPPGATLEQASREVAAVSSRLARAYPATNEGWSAKVAPLDDRHAAGYGAIFGSLLGIVGLFLFIGCANLAGLLVVRNIDRRGELAVCASLGATRLRLARQLALEAGVIALAGALLGIALSSPASRTLAALMPQRLPGLEDVHLSVPVLVFAVAVSIVTALLCGVLPALSLGTVSASEALTGARRLGPRSQRLQNTLVIAEVAVAMILVVGAALMTQSFDRLLNRDRGFNPHGMFALNVSLPFEQDKYLDASLRAAALDGIVSRVAKLPGVTHAGATNGFPGSALGHPRRGHAASAGGRELVRRVSGLAIGDTGLLRGDGRGGQERPGVSRRGHGLVAARGGRQRDVGARDVAGRVSHRQGAPDSFRRRSRYDVRLDGRRCRRPTCTWNARSPSDIFLPVGAAACVLDRSRDADEQAIRRRSPSRCAARCVNSIPIC